MLTAFWGTKDECDLSRGHFVILFPQISLLNFWLVHHPVYVCQYYGAICLLKFNQYDLNSFQ